MSQHHPPHSRPLSAPSFHSVDSHGSASQLTLLQSTSHIALVPSSIEPSHDPRLQLPPYTAPLPSTATQAGPWTTIGLGPGRRLSVLSHRLLPDDDGRHAQHPPPRPPQRPSKNLAFWLVFASLCVSSFLSALDLTTVSTALPTIVSDLHFLRHPHDPSASSTDTATSAAGDYIWIGSAFALSGTAILPWTGALAQIWGRKAVLLASLLLFVGGSTLCGAAKNMGTLIAGRAIQGLGDGGIISLSEIIVADLVPLSERGTYEGVLGVIWAIASAIGPPLGGLLSQRNHWRWLFYLNIPVSILAVLLVSVFMTMKTPQTDLRTKMSQMDWSGNAMVICAMVGLTLALTWGGVRYSWSSPAILVPLILGSLLLVGFFVYEMRFAAYPTLPKALLSNRTSFFGYLTALLHGTIAMAVIYVLPTYFQACLGASPIRSGVMILPLALTVAPSAIVAAASIEVSQKYLPQNYIGWVLSVVGLGLMTLLQTTSRRLVWVAVQIPLGAGMGMLFTTPQFPVLAPLDPSLAAQALALYTFVSSFGQTFGIVIGEAILQNSLDKSLPAAFAPYIPGGSSLSFAGIKLIRHLPEPLKSEVQEAFAQSLRTVWWAMLPLAAVGLLSCLPMRALELHDETDEEYAMVVKEPGK